MTQASTGEGEDGESVPFGDRRITERGRRIGRRSVGLLLSEAEKLEGKKANYAINIYAKYKT